MQICKEFNLFTISDFQPFLLKDASHTRNFFGMNELDQRFKVSFFKDPNKKNAYWEAQFWKFKQSDDNPKHHWKYLGKATAVGYRPPIMIAPKIKFHYLGLWECQSNFVIRDYGNENTHLQISISEM